MSLSTVASKQEYCAIPSNVSLERRKKSHSLYQGTTLAFIQMDYGKS